MSALTIAALSSGAAYRSGLLSILEAGIEVYHVPSLPATVAPTLVLRIDFSEEDLGRRMTLELAIQGPDDSDLAVGGFPVSSKVPTPGEEPELTYYWVLIQTIPLQIRMLGRHVVRISLDGSVLREIPFKVEFQTPNG